MFTKNMFKSLSLFFISFLSFLTVSAQSTITGTIKDERTGEALPGASIVIKGTSQGAATDVEGNFTLSVSNEFPFTVAAEFSGYDPKEIEIYELPEGPLNIVLKSNSVLDEIVVVGYGTQKREELTGSIASVPVELKTQPVSSAERLLQGSISGVQVVQTTGQPGGGVSVRVRGPSSVTGGNEPLYVIDGFPVYNDNSISDAGVTNGAKINPLSSINTSDIESIDVLKDASATAIYGSRGANGVINITTKKGKPGEQSVGYDGYVGVQEIRRTIPLLNAREWGQLKNDAAVNSGQKPAFTQGQLDSLGEGDDWQAAAFRVAKIQNHNLAIISGSEKTRFAISGNYFNQDGILINTNFIRYAGRLNVEHSFNEKFKVLSYITASSTKSNVAPQAVVTSILQMPPSVPIKDANGNYTLRSPYESAVQNPINTLYNQLNDTRTNRFLGNAAVEYEIISGLTAKILFGADLISNKQNRYQPSTVYEGASIGGQANVGTLNTNTWLNENTLNYHKRFAEIHSLDVIAGYTQQASETEATLANAATFATDLFQYNNLGAGTSLQSPASLESKWVLQSFLGRVNYGLHDKYLLTLTVRGDGSSRFGANNKWGYFPSAAVAWNAGKEEFIKNVPVISQLKFRLSAGITGNQQIPPYSSLSQLTYLRYNFGNTIVPGFAPRSIENANLSWEKTSQYDFGIDLGVWKNRVNVVFDLYYKKTTDLLLNVTLPYTTGTTSILKNYGSVENKGLEVYVNSQNLTGKFEWKTTFVYSVNQNKVLSLGDNVEYYIPNNNLPSIAKVGEPLGAFYVYLTDGLIQNGEKPLTSSPNNKPGGQKYKDLDGDGKITQANDRAIAGSAQPKFIAGLTNTFKYSNVDLTLFFQASYGNRLYNQNRGTLELGTGFTNSTRDLLDRWTPSNINTDVHSAFQEPAVVISDRFIEDASYLRLKNISLGYTIPESISKKFRVSNLRIYVSAQNYWTLTKYTGFDPEVSFNEQSTINQGVDNGVYPNNPKTFLGGLSITL